VAVLKMVVAASKSCVAGEKGRVAATITPVIAKNCSPETFEKSEIAVLHFF